MSFFSKFEVSRRNFQNKSPPALPRVNGVERARGRDCRRGGADADDGAAAALLHPGENDAGHLFFFLGRRGGEEEEEKKER